MDTVSANDFGSFLAIHDFIDQQKIPPSSKRLWGALYGFYREYGSVYLSRTFFAKKLNLRKETISRALKVLEKIGVVSRTGEYQASFYPHLELSPSLDQVESPAKVTALQPVIKRSPLSDHPVTEQRLFDHPKKNIEEHIKKQTFVDLSKKEFSPNEKIALKQKLKAIGVYKQSIDRLIAKFSMETINAQIEHLLFQMERGEGIQKPGSWLIAAIEKNFPLPKEMDKNAIEEEQRAEAIRNATRTAQEAKSELAQGNHQKAKELALKSLLLAQNDIAKDTVNEVNQIFERAEKIDKARQLVSAEEQQQVRREEEQKKLNEMRRWFGKSDAEIMNSALFKGAVDALVNQRLLAAT